jgi:hypothetical protein
MKKKENIRAKSKEQRAESQEQRAESKEQRAESQEQRAEGKEQRAESEEKSSEFKVQSSKFREQGTGSEHEFLPIEKACLPAGRGEYGFSREGVNSEQPRPTVSSGREAIRENSTAFNIKKPSAIGIYIPAEGCISGSRAIRACLMIRVFNN